MFGNYGQPVNGQYPNNTYPNYPMTPNPMMQAPPERHSIIHVSGAQSAQAFRMLPNSQCLLLDDTAPIVWLAVSDGTGFSTVTPFYITQQPPVDPQQTGGFEERLRNVEMKLEAMENVQPDSANAGKSRRGKPADPAGE